MTMIDKTSKQYKFCLCGCGKLVKNKFVQGHYIRTIDQKGSKSLNYKGKVKHSSGYIRIFKPEYQFSGKDGYIFEHRYIYEQYYKCCLLSYTIIHHKDGNPSNNFINNLEPMYQKQHNKIHKIGNQYARKLI